MVSYSLRTQEQSERNPHKHLHTPSPTPTCLLASVPRCCLVAHGCRVGEPPRPSPSPTPPHTLPGHLGLLRGGEQALLPLSCRLNIFFFTGPFPPICKPIPYFLNLHKIFLALIPSLATAYFSSLMQIPRDKCLYSLLSLTLLQSGFFLYATQQKPWQGCNDLHAAKWSSGHFFQFCVA